jgi:hypothetical protein
VLIKGLITCAPLLAVVLAWAKIYRIRYVELPRLSSMMALAIVTLLAALSAGTFVYFAFKPSPLPPWQSPEVANFGLLLLFSPIGIVFGLLLFGRWAQAPRWLCWTIEILSVWLFFVGGLEAMAV